MRKQVKQASNFLIDTSLNNSKCLWYDNFTVWGQKQANVFSSPTLLFFFMSTSRYLLLTKCTSLLRQTNLIQFLFKLSTLPVQEERFY